MSSALSRRWGAGLRRRRRQPGQFLIIGDHVAFTDQQIGNLGAFLVDADNRFPARHDKSGDPHQVGETGIGGFCHDDDRVAGRFLLFGVGAVLDPVIAAAKHGDDDNR